MKKIIILMTLAIVIFPSRSFAARWFDHLEWERVATGFGLTEGPVVDDRGTVYFTDMTKNRVYSLDRSGKLSIIRENSENTNGLTLDADGRVVMCEQNGRRISRLEKNELSQKPVQVLAELYAGQRIICPNDIATAKDGSMYFTDPTWHDPPDRKGAVYCIRPDGSLLRVLANMPTPNGVEVSRDGKRLYVGMVDDDLVNVYEIEKDGSLKNGRLFANLQDPDGIAEDAEGRIYVAQWGGGKINVLNPQGNHIGQITVPERRTSNCTFDPSDNRLMYITAGHSVYRVTFVPKAPSTDKSRL